MHSHYVQNSLRTVALAVWGLLRPNQRNEATNMRYYFKGVLIHLKRGSTGVPNKCSVCV